ncbi:hypothetical protein ACROYT_G028794 [Oculina patagonica]
MPKRGNLQTDFSDCVSVKKKKTGRNEVHSEVYEDVVDQVANFLKSTVRLVFADELLKAVVVPEVLVWTIARHQDIKRKTAEELMDF